MNSFSNHIYNYSLLIIGLVSLWGSVVYRIYKLNTIGIFVSVLLVIASTIIIIYYKRFYNRNHFELIPPPVRNLKIFNFKPSHLLLIILYLGSVIAIYYQLFSHQTTEAIISPWQAIPSLFFLIYTISAALLIANIITHNHFSIFLISIFYFLSFTVAVIIFKIGFGFDPFIHSATISLISEFGEVFPKPNYYLGQYSLIIIISKIFHISITFLNTYLVQILAALFIPWSFSRVLGKWFRSKKIRNLAIIFFLIIPSSIFIITTPQNLAFLFLLLVVLLALECKHPLELILIYVLSLAAITTQPIAGIPALFLALLLTIYHSNIKQYRNNLYRLVLLLSCTALPLAFFYIESQNSAPSAESSPFSWPTFFSLPNTFFPNSENFILNALYFYIFNVKFIFLGLAATGMIIAYRFREHCRIFWLPIAMSLSIFISYLISNLLPFNFLINYERTNFSDRLILVSAIFLMPFIMLTFYSLAKKILASPPIIKYSWLFFILLLIPASLYASYPRFDNFHNSHSYSTGRADIEAVKWIENNAESEYIVLANQQVSAAALLEFGFRKYYKNNKGVDIFYYPIPTGGPLYQYYLDMVYEEPSRATIQKAMDLVGVNEAFFVLNKYWWAFPKILEEAKLDANDFVEIDNGEVYVFKYLK